MVIKVSNGELLGVKPIIAVGIEKLVEQIRKVPQCEGCFIRVNGPINKMT